MAFVTPTLLTSERANVFTGIFKAIGRGFIKVAENNSRVRQLEKLANMSDAQLASRGIKREDIVRHVFGDVYFM